MRALPDVLSALPAIPLPHLLIVMVLGGFALAGFAIHAVLSVAKGRDR